MQLTWLTPIHEAEKKKRFPNWSASDMFCLFFFFGQRYERKSLIFSIENIEKLSLEKTIEVFVARKYLGEIF